MPRMPRFFRIFVAALLAIAISAVAAPAAPGTTLVLIPNSLPEGSTRLLLRGLHSGLPESQTIPCRLDLQDDSDEEDALESLRRLQQKIKGESITAVVAAGDRASAFVRMFKDEAPLDAPTVHVAVSHPPAQARATQTQGTEEALVDMVLQTHPETRLLIIFTDMTPQGEATRKRLATLMATMPDRHLLFPGFEPGREGELDEQTIFRTARSAPPGAAILAFGFPMRSAPPDMAEHFASRCLVPVFAGGDMEPVSGMEGCAVTDWQAHGKAAAHLLKATQEHRPPESIPPLVQHDLTADTTASENENPRDEQASPGLTIPLSYAMALAALIPLLSAILIRRKR